jgi:hypothetical protein
MSEVDPALCYLLRSTVSEAKADGHRRHPHLDVYEARTGEAMASDVAVRYRPGGTGRRWVTDPADDTSGG